MLSGYDGARDSSLDSCNKEGGSPSNRSETPIKLSALTPPPLSQALFTSAFFLSSSSPFAECNNLTGEVTGDDSEDVLADVLDTGSELKVSGDSLGYTSCDTAVFSHIW